MVFTPSAKMLARKRSIDVASLIDILSYRRPYNSEGDLEFMNVVLDPIEGMTIDAFGNRYLRIPNEDGSQSSVMWSCHTDSVHAPIKDGVTRQNIKWDAAGNFLGLNEGKPGQCLGADDGAGLWLLLEMIKSDKPGLYIFHVGEEVGGKGSSYIEKHTPELLDGIDFAIAFDRKDTDNVITFQHGQRCCSDAFGNSIAAAMNRIDKLAYKLDTTGSFTDTANYTDLVAECTNISVGYYNAHGPREILDIRHMIRLRDAVLQLDPVVDFALARKAGDRESKWSTPYYGNFTPKKPGQKLLEDAKKKAAKANNDTDAYNEWLASQYDDPNVVLGGNDQSEESIFEALIRMIPRFPEAAARMLLEAGFDQWDFADKALLYAFQDAAERNPDADLAGETMSIEIDLSSPEADFLPEVECANCTAKVDMADVDVDMRCPYCYFSLEDPVSEAIAAQDKAMETGNA